MHILYTYLLNSILAILCTYFICIISDSISYPNVKAFKHQHITLISLNKPEEKNLLNLATIGDLKKSISNYENDDLSTIAILYGEGGSFCAGLESEELAIEQIYNVPNNKHI